MLRLLQVLMATLVLTGLALANPLLEEDFWKTATPADVEQAVQQGAKVDARGQGGETLLHVAARSNPNLEILTTLVRLGAQVNARDQVGWTPLHQAAAFNPNPQIVLTLLELGADPKAKTNRGETPWHLIQGNDKLKNTEAYWRLSDLRY